MTADNRCQHCGVYDGQYHGPNCQERVPIDNDDTDPDNGCCGECDGECSQKGIVHARGDESSLPAVISETPTDRARADERSFATL
jgi:hypothetical protein